jgi:hypothetical protein
MAKNKRVGQEELLIDIASLAMKITANYHDGKSCSTKQAAVDQLEIHFGLCQGSHIVTNSGLNSRNLIKQKLKNFTPVMLCSFVHFYHWTKFSKPT